MSDIFEPIAATNFSFLRGASHAREMVEQAHKLGLSGIGIADKNTLAGVVRAYTAARELGMRLIVGARLVETNGFTIVIYPKNRTAWGNLCRILTIGNRRSKKGTCTLYEDDVLAAMEEACAIIIPPDILDENWFELAKSRIQKAPPNCAIFIAITRPYDGTDFERNSRLNAFALAIKATLIATNDAIMHEPNRRVVADVLACIREKTTLEHAGFLLLQNAERHLKPPEEMARIFVNFTDAIKAQKTLFDLVNFSLDELKYEFPDVMVSQTTPISLNNHLIHLTEIGAKQRYPNGIPPKVRETIDHEYKLIEELDYARYFLTVHDIVSFARKEGILCQGRGSAANSAVCFCLGITSVDPEKIDLLFERFVSPERREPPDIDVDFQNDRREEVIQYIYEKYGRAHAGITGVVVTYRGRSALREVAKTLSLPNDIIDALSKSVSGWGRGSVDKAIIAQMTGLDMDAPRIKETIEIAKLLHGFPRHLSQHVGGFVITKSRLDEVVPISNAAMDNRTFIEWDKDDLDALGILKIDVLALGMLTCVSKCFEILSDKYGRDYDMATIPAEDSVTYDMICKADTVGVFQIESRAQMSMLPRLKPREFYDLVIEVAIVRPGPIQGDMVHPYLRRRQGFEKVVFPSKALEQVLGKTLGVPLFQEQAMKIAIVAAGFSAGEADRLRRAMATFRKVGIIHEFGEKLVGGMMKNGYERDFAERCFKQIEGFGEYGFPESHAASFALIVYVSAWLKCHYPDVFLVAILNAQPMGFYAASQLVQDAKNHGVKILPPDVNHSEWDNILEKTESGKYAVRLGLRQIKGFMEIDAAKIIAIRPDEFFETPEQIKRGARLNDRAMELLSSADAFSSLDLSRRGALWQAKGLKSGELPLFAQISEYGHEEETTLPQMQWSEEVVHDYKSLRLSLKGHPLEFFREEFLSKGLKSSSDIKNMPNGSFVGVAGLVILRQRPGTAKGVLFMTLEDEFGSMNLIVWPKTMEKYRKECLRGKFVVVYGHLQKGEPTKGARHIRQAVSDKETIVIHIISIRIIDISHRLAELEWQKPSNEKTNAAITHNYETHPAFR
ncbi:MAG: error-prone DNA polymerase [Hyphomonadaceae bacterium]|nr:MAG: error-prone DNA polymerase [Hyphomonadaceae bacterium]KAF0186861.1 MAG: error-prone DNA polymerase [Hyphomonadaceae bacterium]